MMNRLILWKKPALSSPVAKSENLNLCFSLMTGPCLIQAEFIGPA
ncbi:hypothetical protein [Komagataeibacter xylinus]|nr:hypothetical protein [Komagataeibacter xylinus]